MTGISVNREVQKSILVEILLVEQLLFIKNYSFELKNNPIK